MTGPLTLDGYQNRARLTDRRRGIDDGLGFPLLGLFGEVGSLLSVVKRKQRETVAYPGYRDAVLEEFGDVLWYLAALAGRGGLSLNELIGGGNDERLHDWWRADPDRHSAASRLASGAAPDPSPAFERALHRLAAEVGLLMADHEAGRLDRDRSALKERLTAVLRALGLAASTAGIALETAARANLEKIFDRWPVDRIPPPFPDEAFPERERLPRRLAVRLAEVDLDGRKTVRMTLDGRPFGDPLSDNRLREDDYRFHDVFHLAHAAFLGWSPTLRRMLNAKRKSDPAIDEGEDGARAIVTEEGVSAWVFSHARRLNYFAGMSSLDYGLLKSVRRFVAGYEVDACPLWLWEEAILEGYEVFRAVREHRGGRVTADLENRSIRFDAP